MPKPLTFDSLTLACVADGLQALCDGRVQHIAQPHEHAVVLTVYKSGYGEVRWLLDCSAQWARTHIITRKPANPPQPPNFCMLLRKHLEGGRLMAIAQRRFDRVLDITIVGHEGATYLLTVELMGRHSNVILVSAERQILHAAKLISSKVSRVRQVLPGHPYTPPPAPGRPDPRAVTEAEFGSWLRTDAPDDTDAWLRGTFEGVSAALAQVPQLRSQRFFYCIFGALDGAN